MFSPKILSLQCLVSHALNTLSLNERPGVEKLQNGLELSKKHVSVEHGILLKKMTSTTIGSPKIGVESVNLY